MSNTAKAAKARKQAAPPSPDFDLARLDAEWSAAGRKAAAGLAGTIDEPELARLESEWQAAGRKAHASLAPAGRRRAK
jgi:hypothetical protein